MTHNSWKVLENVNDCCIDTQIIEAYNNKGNRAGQMLPRFVVETGFIAKIK